jgi:hypothetical protein
MFADEATTDPRFNSSSYDLGTWYFHGTGFTSAGFIDSYSASDAGNVVKLYRGARRNDASVPALPLFGAALIAASLAAGGATALLRAR